MAPVCTSSEVNLLIYHYLKESGFSHSCFSLRHEGRLDEDPLSKEAIIEPGRLIRVLQKGLLYLAVEAHVNEDGTEKPCSAPFRLVGAPHVCDGRARSPLSQEPSTAGRATSLTPPPEAASRPPMRDAAAQTAAVAVAPVAPAADQAEASTSQLASSTAAGKRKETEEQLARSERDEKRPRRDESAPPNGNGKGKHSGPVDESMDADTSLEGAQDTLAVPANGASPRERTTTPEAPTGPAGNKKKKKKGGGDSKNSKNPHRATSAAVPEKGKDPGTRKYPKQIEDGKHFESSDVRILAGHTGEVFVSAWNPTVPDLLASGAGDATVRIWDLASDDAPLELQAAADDDPVAQAVTTKTICKHLPATHAKDVTTLDWNPDGTLLASGSYDGILRLWTPQGDLHLVMSMHQGPIFAVRWNRKGTQLLTASQDSTAIVWDLSSGKVRQQYALHSDSVLDVDWLSSPKASSSKDAALDYIPSGVLAAQDSIFATCSADNSINLLQLGKPKPIRTFKGHSDEVNAIAFDHSHTLLASASDDFTAKIWALDTAVSGLPEARSVSPASGRKRQSPDANGAMDVDASDAAPGGALSASESGGAGSAAAPAMDSSSPTGLPGGKGSSSATKPSKGLRFTLKGHTRELYALAWAPSGPCTANADAPRMLATSAFDHTARLWNAEDGSCLRVINDHKDSVYSLAFSPDAKLVVTGGIDEMVYISRVSDGSIVRHFKASGAVMDIQWHTESASSGSGSRPRPNGLPASPVKKEKDGAQASSSSASGAVAAAESDAQASLASDAAGALANGSAATTSASSSLGARLSIAQQNKVLCVLRLDKVNLGGG